MNAVTRDASHSSPTELRSSDFSTEPDFSSGRLIVLRGATGSRKTDVLRALAVCGAQVLDLEALAHHRGSAFGGLDLPEQPSHAKFQQRIDRAWRDFDLDRLIFAEHCGPYLGSVGLPLELLKQLNRAPWILLESTDVERVDRLLDTYGVLGIKVLKKALKRLRQRLGTELAREARRALRREDRRAFLEMLLPYYDRAYTHQIDTVTGHRLAVLEVDGSTLDELARRILDLTKARALKGESQSM